jgi:glycosyltransferase involved in cell wall biosynthesis
MKPLVSVIIPVYNRESTIMRALNSVLNQTYYNIEVIVVDDCSTDSTVQTVSMCTDSRVQLICLPFHCGANAARNRGIERSKGEYIAFQDSDDEWIENKLDKQINYMMDTGDEVSYSPYILYENGKCSIVPYDYKNRAICEINISQTLKRDNIVGTPTLMVKKEVFSVVGLFDENLKRMQDYELIMRLIKKYRFGYIDEPLVRAYRTQRSITTDHNILPDTYVRLLEKHIDFLDLEKLLYDYYNSCDFSLNNELKWNNIERVMTIVRNYDKGKYEKRCYQITMRYLYEQFKAGQSVIKDWYHFFEEHLRTHEFAIYGAGAYGHKVYGDLKEKKYYPKYFLVTRENETRDIEGIPIISLSDCDNVEIPVIIAVAWDKQSDLIRNLLEKGMNKFCIYPFCHR